jgi:hypothetical protein
MTSASCGTGTADIAHVQMVGRIVAAEHLESELFKYVVIVDSVR